MKTERKKRKVFLSPLRLRKERRAQRNTALCLLVYLVGIALGALAAGILETANEPLYTYIANLSAAASGRALLPGFLACLAPAAVASAAITGAGLCAVGMFAVPPLLLLCGACYGAAAGAVARAYGSSGVAAILCTEALPKALLAVALCLLAKRAIETSSALFAIAFKKNGPIENCDTAELLGSSLTVFCTLAVLCVFEAAAEKIILPVFI